MKIHANELELGHIGRNVQVDTAKGRIMGRLDRVFSPHDGVAFLMVGGDKVTVGGDHPVLIQQCSVAFEIDNLGEDIADMVDDIIDRLPLAGPGPLA